MKEALSLCYPEGAEAPIVTAKGRGYVAQRMMDIAARHGVPVIRDEVLADVLSVQQIGACIPEETWYAVAGIFAYIKKVQGHGKTFKN